MNTFQRLCYKFFWRTYLKLTGFNPGVYIQDFDHCHIGKNCHFGSGAAVIAINHDPKDVARHRGWNDVHIGDNSWLGSNAVVLPGVRLGENTIVGAGAVVTKSFPEGWCILVGNPAWKLRDLRGEDQ